MPAGTGTRASHAAPARRLSLRSLPSATRAWAVLLLVAIGLVALLVGIVAMAAVSATLAGQPMPDVVSLGLPLGVVETGTHGMAPVAAIALLYGGSAVVAGAAGHAIGLPAWPFRRLTAVTVAWVGASMAALLLAQVRELRELEPTVPAAGGSVALALVLGWIGLVSAVAFGVIGVASWRAPARQRVRTGWRAAIDRALPFLAATPFACLLIGFLLADDTVRDAGNPGARGLLAAPGVLVLELLGIATAVVTMWGTLALALTARRIGGAIGPVERRGALTVLAIVLGVKGAWIAVGLGGHLPVEFTALRTAWDLSRTDGSPAWAIAFALALAFVLFVTAARSRISDTGARAATWVLVAGFTLGSLVAAVIVMSLPIVAIVMPWAYGPLVTAERNLREAFLPTQLTVVLLTPLLGLLLWRSGHRSAAVLLGVVAAWCLPRGISILAMVAGDPGTDALLTALHVEPITMDVAITVLIAVASLNHVRGTTPAIEPRIAIVLLVTIGLVTYTGSLVPAGLELVAFYALLLYPVVWSLAFDARTANLPGLGRPTRVMMLLVPMAGLLVLSTLPAATGRLEGISNADLARVLLLLPFAAVMVLAWWGREARLPALDAPQPWAARPRHGFVLAPRPRRMPRGEALRWLALGLTAVVCVAALVHLDARGRPRLVAVAPGEIRFGADLEALEHLVVGPSEAFTQGDLFAFIAHLRRPPDGQLMLRVARVAPSSDPQDVPWSIAPGEVWVSVSRQDVLSSVPGRFALTFFDGSEILATGEFQVTRAVPVASAAPSMP